LIDGGELKWLGPEEDEGAEGPREAGEPPAAPSAVARNAAIPSRMPEAFPASLKAAQNVARACWDRTAERGLERTAQVRRRNELWDMDTGTCIILPGSRAG
jgi:hypothetical protein